ncbi:helix-turn-helix domain-containing protein [Lachnotalea sp. AF33-28]|uniref:helix-turn-helix domain-containing protein n=1 Tax=Lachnotalea sp. AF33-28 TaxID=2292046 RepID=UPI000E54B3B2|nr:helix-turn-helix domain-containing protein [Lachnotalea sp. AF33-28]RHP31707.1 AraC family transcriptional regulator [Lachnotalea sp. AF33-28]
MNHLKRYTKKKFEKRILVYLMLISTIPVLVLGITSYFSSVRHATEQMDASNDSALLQTMQGVDSVLDNIKQYYGTVADSAELRPLMESRTAGAGYAALQSFMEVMASKIDFIHYISGYSLVNIKSGWIYGNQGIYHVDEVENREELKHLLSSKKEMPTFWLNHTYEEWSSPSPYVDLSYLSLIFRLPLISEEKYSMLIINMDRGAVEKLFQGSGSMGNMLVLDSNGELLYAENREIGQAAQEQLTTGYERTQTEKGSVFRDLFQYDGHTYHMSAVISSNSEWTYVSYYDERLTQTGANEILLTAIGISVAMLLAVFLFSLLGTYQIYKPVKTTFENIHDLFLPQDTEEEHGDEFGYIERGINHLYAHNQELSVMVQMQQEQLTELFTLRLMRGQMTQETLQSNLELLHITPRKFMSVILLAVSSHREGRRLSDAELDALYLAIAKGVPEKMSELLIVAPVNYLHALVFLTGDDDEQRLEEKQEEVYRVMNQYVRQTFESPIKAGISRPFRNLLDFRKAYNESVEALKVERQSHVSWDLSDTEERLTYYSDVAPEDKESNTYNIVIQNQMKDAVDKCDEAQAFQVVDQFLAEIRGNGVRLNEQYYFLHRFLVAVLNVASDAGLNINSLYPESASNLFRQLDSQFSWDDIAAFYKDTLIRPMIARLKDLRKNSRSMILEKIEQLVKERDGDITLTECADQINCHANYIWRILKDTRQQTFSDFVAEVRMAKAKELLKREELAVGDIADMLKFTNPQNFIRYFKKYANMTPGQYRKKMQSETERTG